MATAAGLSGGSFKKLTECRRLFGNMPLFITALLRFVFDPHFIYEHQVSILYLNFSWLKFTVRDWYKYSIFFALWMKILHFNTIYWKLRRLRHLHKVTWRTTLELRMSSILVHSLRCYEANGSHTIMYSQKIRYNFYHPSANT